VELARALLLSPSILILDEISSKLTPQEMEIVYRIIRDYKREGKSIIYISHNMDEIFEFADRVTVLKDGIRRGTEEITNIDRVKLINLTYSFVLSREELTQTNIELYNYKKYNEDIIKNLPVGVIILGPDGKVYLANYSAVLILSVEQEELSERGLDTFLPRIESGVADEVKKAVAGMERRSWEEVRFGEDKILKLTIFPFVDEKTAHLGTILLVEDVSKDFHIKNYLIRAEKVASVAELAAGVAHEINNPLGIMANYLEIVKQRQLPGDVREKVQKMENELHRIVDIIGSLLSFSRITDYPMRSVPLFSVVREAVLLLRHRIEAKGIHFSSDMGDEEAFILGDENKLKQVFINLIMNSIEAVLDGGEVSVLHEIDRENGIAEVMIADNGYGIPEDIRNRIFDPFFSTKATKTNTGLGLSICQHIVEAYHGIISCASSPGRTIFTVSLPLAPPEGRAR
jgi:two-component system sensor histidine kinase AtoS